MPLEVCAHCKQPISRRANYVRGVTFKQRQLYEAVTEFRAKMGYWPTRGHAALMMGVRSKGQIHEMLERLERFGFVVRPTVEDNRHARAA